MHSLSDDNSKHFPPSSSKFSDRTKAGHTIYLMHIALVALNLILSLRRILSSRWSLNLIQMSLILSSHWSLNLIQSPSLSLNLSVLSSLSFHLNPKWNLSRNARKIIHPKKSIYAVRSRKARQEANLPLLYSYLSFG